MYEGRDLRQEIDELGIVAMEDFGTGSPESAFAALDAIREHNKQYPVKKLIEMNDNAMKEVYAIMSGIRNTEGEN
ncbi:MAG: hypothetical protein FWC03_08455 [Treponema sp.]|nr:hypothetical protein [Treponema sp.]